MTLCPFSMLDIDQALSKTGCNVMLDRMFGAHCPLNLKLPSEDHYIKLKKSRDVSVYQSNLSYCCTDTDKFIAELH